jgi:predicted secreted protein
MGKTIFAVIAFAMLPLTIIPAAAHENGVAMIQGRVSLQGQASLEVDNDVMRATLFTEAEDTNPAKLAEQINRAIAEATKIAKAQSGVKVKTGSYNTYPVYDKNKITRWRARSDLLLESTDFKVLATLIGKLQNTMSLGGVDFSVSEELRKKADDDLTEAAIADFRRRADLIVKSFGAKGYKLIDAAVNSNGMPPPVPMMEMAQARVLKADVVTPPTLEAGSSRLNGIVSGTIQLEGIQ